MLKFTLPINDEATLDRQREACKAGHTTYAKHYDNLAHDARQHGCIAEYVALKNRADKHWLLARS